MADERTPFEGTEQVASFTECTGLIPALPQDEQQDEHYAALYATHKAQKGRKMYRKR